MKKSARYMESGNGIAQLSLKIAAIFLITFGVPAVAQNHPELDWRVFETDHFRVQFHQGLEHAARYTAKVAEAAYQPVTELYRYEPPDKIRIILKDYDDYANGAAFFYLDTMEIWTTPLDHDFDMRGTTDWLGNVVTHEFTHMISLGAARKGPDRVPAAFVQWLAYQRESNRPDILIGYPDVLVSYPIMMTVVPMWFAEGVAQYQVAEARYDRWDSHRDMALRTAVLNDQLLSFDDMGVFSKRGFGNEFVYDHGYGLVRYIASEYGDQALADLCDEVSSWHAMEIDSAIDQVLGLSTAELHDAWRSAMSQTYRAQLEGLGTLNEGEAVTEEGFSNIHPAYSPDGKRLAYLTTGKGDYGPHALVVRNLEGDDEGEDELIQPGVVSSISWSPDGEHLVYVQKRRADKYGSRQADLFEYSFAAADRGLASKIMWTPASMVSGYAPESPRVRRLTSGIRALYPAHSPDGKHIAFVRNQGSTNNLGLMRTDGSDIRYLTDFVDGTQLYTPRWSPDGTKMVLSVSSGGQRDIALLDIDMTADAPARYSAADFQYLVATEGTDRDPVWSADGSKVVFSSDQSGIFNLYAIDVATRQTTMLTNVVGGALNPTVRANGDIAFSAYGSDGYQIRSIGGSEAAQTESEGPRGTLSPAEHAQVVPSKLASPWPIKEVEGESQPYGVDFLRTMIIPRLIVDEGRFKAGAYLAASDVLSKQNIFIGAAVAPTNLDRDLFAIYEYRKWRPTLFLEFFHQKKNTTRRDSSEANTGIITGMDFSLSQVSTGLSGRLGKSAELRLSATYDRYDASLKWDAFVPRRDGQSGFNRQKQKPFGYTYLHGFGLGATYRMEAISRRRDREINPRGGRRIYFRYDRMFNYFLRGFDENNTSFLDEQYLRLFYNQFTLDWQEFVGLPNNSSLGIRFYGGWIASDNVDDDVLVNDFFDYHLGGLNFMKGYSFYSLEGRKAAMTSLTLRTPLFSDIRQRLAHLYIDKVYGALYADVGKAWDDNHDDPDPIYDRTGPMRDAGGQLRFDLLSYYGMPTRIQFDVAYGIDEPAGRSPWKYYFTMLFGYL